MTIATFCRDELLASGPLTLDELAARALRAGVTRSSDPRAAVRRAMQHRELELAGERWVTPLWLLEGRCLTTPALGIREWTCDPRDTSEQDLGLLRLAVRLAPIPLAGGGYLRSRNPWGGWRSSTRLPEPRAGELLCLRLRGGVLEPSVIPAAVTRTPDAARVGAALDAIVPSHRYGWRAGTAVLQRLAELVLADDALLRSPLPPLSECCALLAAERARQEALEEEDPWDDLWGDELWEDESWYGGFGYGGPSPRERWLRALP